MATPILLLLTILLAIASDAGAGERRGRVDRLRLAPSEVPGFLASGVSAAPDEPRGFAILSRLDELAARGAGFAPFITLLAAPAPAGDEPRNRMLPLVAFGARVQGRTLVAFTRPGARVDPDDRVVYQRLVASDLFEGRRFSVTVYEDHALGPSTAQVLGFGARVMLRPAFELHGWRTRVEIFASYDVTQGATGYVGLVAHPLR